MPIHLQLLFFYSRKSLWDMPCKATTGFYIHPYSWIWFEFQRMYLIFVFDHKGECLFCSSYQLSVLTKFNIIRDVSDSIFISAYITTEPRTSSKQLKPLLARLVILRKQRYMLHIKKHFKHLEVSSISVLPSVQVIATLHISRFETLIPRTWGKDII